jgi:hypothetical protein
VQCTKGIWSSTPTGKPALPVGGFEISKGASLPERPALQRTQYWLNHQDSVLVHIAFQYSTFCPLKAWLGSLATLTHLTWPLVDFLYLQRHLLQDVPDIQEQLLIFLHMIATGQCQQQQQSIHCMNWKGTTFNWTTVKNNNCKDIICYQFSLGTYGYALICLMYHIALLAHHNTVCEEWKLCYFLPLISVIMQ